MPIRVRHQPIDLARTWKIHAWIGSTAWDITGETSAGPEITFSIPDVDDARLLQFKFHCIDLQTHEDVWEPDDFVRRVRIAQPTDIWSFEAAARILYQPPFPAHVSFRPGDVLTFNLVTQSRFSGGRLFAWNPYDAAQQPAYFGESSRSDSVSTFRVPLAAWMTRGFHFKFIGHDEHGNDLWEPDAANRVWRPCDGDSMWLKSGQVSVRSEPLSLTTLPVEVLFAASLGSPPALDLLDPVEGLHQVLQGNAAPFAANPLFQVARYAAPIYPDAVYAIAVLQAEGDNPSYRPFPALNADPASPSRLIVGASDWVTDFPATPSITLVIGQRASSTFESGLNVSIGVGTATTAYQTKAARQADGTWQTQLSVVPNRQHWILLTPAAGDEPRPYDWIDPRRFFVAPAAASTYFTFEGVYGVSPRSLPHFQEPPSRLALMQAAFGDAIASAGIFAANEMPHGATIVGGDVYFVAHAPHAADAAVVLIDHENARRPVPMTLTGDTFYWWCRVPATDAPPGTWYHLLLNGSQEINDPAAREVVDRGSFETALGDLPTNPGTSWSVVLDVASLRATAHQAPWRTMGWESLLTYEIHPKRFTDLNVNGFAPLDLLADELLPVCRRNQPGYLHDLPVTALQIMPINEFKSTNSWGYNPAFFFAIDGGYGGSTAFARLANATHASGRGVMLDLVYNHMNDSPLTQIAADVYCNGQAWGDRINSGHPMVKQFLRQAILHLWRTFGLDGFRFDDTKTIVGNVGGWDFLATIRGAVRAAASAEGQPWPYLVAENDPKFWDITNPAWGVTDGQWDITEVYDLGHAAYDPWQATDDHASAVKADMDLPETWVRPFFEATRFGESHDTVSGQDPGNKRIAARPPFGQGYQMAKAIGTVPLLSNGVPMLFMGEEVGETRFFSFDNDGPVTNPQVYNLNGSAATDNTRILSWFRSLMGLRNDTSKGLRGNDNLQVTKIGRRTVAFSCGSWQRLFVVVTFGTENQQQDSSWLGLPNNGSYKEIFNSSWPAFQVEFEPEHTNGGYDAQIQSGHILNLPYIGAVVLERR